MKFNLNQSIQLTYEKKMMCMRIESSLLHFEKQATKILQGVTLEGSKLNTNSSPIEELGLEPILNIPEVEEIIFRTYEDEEAAMAKNDDWPKQGASTFLMSLVGL